MFYNSMWSVLPMRPKARVLALISVIPKLLCAVYQQLELPNALSWPALSSSDSMGCPFPTPFMVKIKPTGSLSSSWASQDANQGQYSSFLPHMSSSPPPIQYCAQPPLRHTEHMTSKREYSKGRSQIFLAASSLGPAPLATTADTTTMAPPLILSYSYSCYMFAFTCQQGEQGWTKSYAWQQNKFGFLPFYCSMHTCNHTHSVFLIWY